MGERKQWDTLTTIAFGALCAFGAFVVGNFSGAQRTHKAVDAYYAEHPAIPEHIIAGMGFEGDCRVVVPTGSKPATQHYNDNTFNVREGPCFIGVPGSMEITRRNEHEPLCCKIPADPPAPQAKRPAKRVTPTSATVTVLQDTQDSCEYHGDIWNAEDGQCMWNPRWFKELPFTYDGKEYKTAEDCRAEDWPVQEGFNESGKLLHAWCSIVPQAKPRPKFEAGPMPLAYHGLPVCEIYQGGGLIDCETGRPVIVPGTIQVPKDWKSSSLAGGQAVPQ